MKRSFEITTPSSQSTDAPLKISASAKVSIKDLLREADVYFAKGDYQRAINSCVTCLAAESVHPASKKLSQKAIKSKLTYFLEKASSRTELGGNDKENKISGDGGGEELEEMGMGDLFE